MSAILSISRNELRIATRNRWIVTAIAIMTMFSLILAFAGSAPVGALGVDRLTVTVSSLATLCVYLVPLLALLLSYDSIVGEIDRGTLPLILTYPVARWQILAGKYLAQLVVVAAAIFIGTGSAAGAIWIAGHDIGPGIAHLIRLQWSAVLLGAVFLAVGNVVSAATRQSVAAASLAVGVWIVAVVMVDVALLGAVVADDGGFFTKTLFPWLLALSPADAFRLFNLLAIEAAVQNDWAVAPRTLGLPQLVPIATMVAWAALMLGATAALFRRIEP
ncbi:MAG: ABC transporter permease [Alphaproteobacteria bacterium]